VLSTTINVILPILAIAGLGLLLDRFFHFDVHQLSTLLLYAFAPALVFSSLATSTLVAADVWGIFAAGLLVGLISAGANWGLGRASGFGGADLDALLMVTVMFNTGNYGLPFNLFAFGQAGFERAVIFFVSNALISNTFGVYLASRSKFTPRQALTNVFKLPLVYAMGLGLALNLLGLTMPLPIERLMTLLGEVAIPLMLIILGIQLGRIRLQSRASESSTSPALRIGLATASKLALVPLIAVGVASMLGLEGLTRSVVVVQSAMPSAAMTTVYATRFENESDVIPGTVLVGTLLSVVSLPLWLGWLGM
jgi:predicted permease